ncbi:MAG: murein biosynthesis integral membrane protein MurJ [Rhodospirillaceae bacterium]|nr:murein biosynthesis integral membrane protein MurJ [Rhodospirillaceae bacterium]
MVRSVATVGGLNMASRVLGLARDVMIARVLGTGPVADAFFVALRFPNLFRNLFAEGAFNAAFVPMFAGRLETRGPDAARAFAEQVLAVLLTVLLVLTVAAQAAMPGIMRVMTPGFTEPDKFALAVLFTRITFPYLLLMSLSALYGGILNSLHRYGHAAAAPIAFNIVQILGLVAVVPFIGMPGHVLSWAVTVSGVWQLLWLAYGSWRAGMTLRLRVPRLTGAVKRLVRLMLPGILGGGAMQINALVGTVIASLQPGAVSYLQYADRIYQFPLAIIGTAAGVVLLPLLTRALRAGREELAMETLNRGLELTMLLTLPATAALVVIARPIVTVLYERGAFSVAAGDATALAVLAYAVGLPAYVLVKCLTPCFFAREDTDTPFRYAVVAMAANVALSVGLFYAIGFAGIALATALASWLNVALLAGTLRARGQLAIDAQRRRRLPRMLAAAAAMAVALWFAAGALAPLFAGPLLHQVAALAALVAGGLAVYAGLALVIGAVSPEEIRHGLRRRSGEGA